MFSEQQVFEKEPPRRIDYYSACDNETIATHSSGAHHGDTDNWPMMSHPKDVLNYLLI